MKRFTLTTVTVAALALLTTISASASDRFAGNSHRNSYTAQNSYGAHGNGYGSRYNAGHGNSYRQKLTHGNAYGSEFNGGHNGRSLGHGGAYGNRNHGNSYSAYGNGHGSYGYNSSLNSRRSHGRGYNSRLSIQTPGYGFYYSR